MSLVNVGYIQITKNCVNSDFIDTILTLLIKKPHLDTSSILSDTDEVWDMTELASILSQEYQKCRFKDHNQMEL